MAWRKKAKKPKHSARGRSYTDDKADRIFRETGYYVSGDDVRLPRGGEHRKPRRRFGRGD